MKTSRNLTDPDTLSVNEQHELAANVAWQRAAFFSSMLDPRRDTYTECGYSDSSEMDADFYKNYYDRESIAQKVVNMYRGCWRQQPTVFEDEDPDVITPWEIAWDNLCNQVKGMSWFKDETGSPMWEYLSRVDKLSGIGRFGVIFLGLMDKKPLTSPAKMREKDDLATNLIMEDDDVVEEFNESPQDEELVELAYMRVFDESNVKIIKFDDNESSLRYGQPLTYRLTLANPASSEGMQGFKSNTIDVNWTRIRHVADNLDSSELYGVPRMQSVMHHIQNLHKLYGGSAEMYWRGAFPGISLETQPQLGGSVKINRETLKAEVENYQNTLQRYMLLSGITAKTLAPQVVDPTPQIDTQITAICINKDCPKRVLMGSERGQLASGQDDDHWTDVLTERRLNYLTPQVVIPFVNQLIALRVLPVPKKSLHVSWPDIKEMKPKERAEINMLKIEALIKFVQGGGDNMMAPSDLYTRLLNMTEHETKIILANVKKYLATQNPDVDTEDIIPGRDPKMDMMQDGQPQDGQALDPATRRSDMTNKGNGRAGKTGVDGKRGGGA